MRDYFKKNWHFIIVFGIIIAELITFLCAGEMGTYIGVHDNLDIHITDYKLLRDNHAFFSHGQIIPLLGGIDRNFLLSEFYLYSLLHAALPTYTAYIAGHFIKILIALFSGILLGKDILKDSYKKYDKAVVLFSFIYGLLPLYPAFSFSFSSIPLLVWLIRKIERREGRLYYLLLFLYPTLSYFTFFGPFILGYVFIYFVYRWIVSKKISLPLLSSVFILASGYVLIEYRLFLIIFTSGQATIRDTMVVDNATPPEILSTIGDVFVNNMFHCDDLHRFFALPVTIAAFFVINFLHIKNKELKQLIKDPFNLVLLFILLNCTVYGLYNSFFVRTLFEKIVPPLKGWQFNRTLFFNPFLWYLEVFIVIKRLIDDKKKKFAVTLTAFTLISVLGVQSLYNDFFNTLYVNAWQLVKHEKSETLSYGEFFSEDLFAEIKKDIGYSGEYSIAYGFHPAVLSYNSISTLDGCLSYYYQSYKNSFRKVIEPALNESKEARKYYDEWGARAYIFSGSVESIWNPERTKDPDDKRLLIDTSSMKALGGKYIFSRIEISNAKELNASLIGKYKNDSSPYSIWVYEI
ncbi:DUF6044 family protein [Butyrivibrio sp. INlla21]|uniref:DUF6044 family protein n=1 Tax=Butyrivibrio sp. INlla21 TaxID=1520811 RepID=UPI0008DECA6B|nr:DUF6044 family protein [Butyrivibrio sp. INlla21]SFU52710.1 hypothetical protein SAMN02910342_00780 [Butyrivibrio sp. INlla21]